MSFLLKFALLLIHLASPVALGASLCSQVLASARQGIMSSVDSPTHMIFSLGDASGIMTLMSILKAMNRNIVPLVVVPESYRLDSMMQTQLARLTASNRKTEFVYVSFGDGSTTFANTVSPWARDLAPELVLKGRQQYFVGFRYFRGDVYAQAAQEGIARHLGLPLKRVNLILEGGAYRLGPDGVLYASTQILKNNSKEGLEFLLKLPSADWDKNQPSLVPRQRAEIEAILISNLNVREIVWFEPLQVGVEATGHMDMYFQFLSPSEKRVMVIKIEAKEEVSDSFSNKIRLSNQSLDRMAEEFRKRGYGVEREVVNSVPGMLFTVANSVFDGQQYLTTNIDWRSSPRIGYTQDLDYKKWGIPARTVGPFESLYSGGGIHCLSRTCAVGKHPGSLLETR